MTLWIGNAFTGKHQLLAFGGVGGVNADGDMHLRLVQKILQLRKLADGGDGDALRAPGHSPLSRHDLYDGEERVEVVEGLAHPHEDHVGQLLCGCLPFAATGGMLRIWLMIWAAVRLALNPSRPVAQK